MSAFIYLEGGGDAKDLHIRCREAFRKLLKRGGFSGRLPRLIACGGRNAAFADFKTNHQNKGDATFVAMLIDSEGPLQDIEATWAHLQRQDRWIKPDGTRDEQVLFMTTCMETWIVADHATLTEHYGNDLQSSALPPLNNLESRSPQELFQKLMHATRDCGNAYGKGKPSFEVLEKLSPAVLKQHFPSFGRVFRILERNL